MKHIYKKINGLIASYCKPCGKEKNMYKITHIQNRHKEQKKVHIVGSGWNSIVRKMIAKTRMI